MFEDPDRRRNDTKANDMEGRNSQQDQNQRKAVVTGFHDSTRSTRHTERNHTDYRNVNGTNSDPVSNKADQFNDNDEKITLPDQQTY